MRTVGSGEDVRAREIRVGAHIEVVGLGRIQHKINGLAVRAADRSRGQPAVFVRIVRRVNLQMSLEHAAHLEVAGGVDNRGTRLQEHTFVQSVEVEAGDDGHLLFVVGLALHDGGKDGDLGRGESDRVGFVATLVCPELVVFARHAAEEVIRRDSPIDFVGIGQE